MTQPFIHDNFLLQTGQAVELYHRYAKNLPIIDYHCHLPSAEVADDQRFENLTQVWLYGDHYKWRQMRTNGIDEHRCTGDASDWEKFLAWAETVPRALRNPLYHWTHLELDRIFGVRDRQLGPGTAQSIWEEGQAKLALPEFSVRNIMRRMNVALVCTTDDPTDTLEHHQAIAADPSFDIRVLPTFRPDKGMAVENPAAFNAWVDRLGQAADVDVSSFSAYLDAIRKRHDFFHQTGCRLSDHGIETAYAEDYTDTQVAAVFAKIRSGKTLDAFEILQFKSAMLVEFGLMDAEKNWTYQLHLGALRNNNTRRFNEIGPDTGFDSIGDFEIARPLSSLLDRLDQRDALPKTILYNLNPADNAVMASMIGNFQDGSVPGKIQFGSGWWFNDTIRGMETQMDFLSEMGLLSRFVGMVTDSRSFLSYPRHEYFRRILCNLIGRDMADGLIPGDIELAGRMIADISYHNAANYFGFDLKPVPAS